MKEITAVIITLNEEENLERCLASVAFCDQILVVDGGSTDHTVDIAPRYGAHVVENVRGGRIRQRHVCLEHVKTEWLLSIDADEEVSTPLQEEILRFLEDPECIDCCFIPMQHYFVSRWISYCGWWFPDFKPRLMKTALCGVSTTHAHDSLTCSGKHDKRLKHLLYHHSYQSLDQYFEKFNPYTSRQALDMLEEEPALTPSRLVFKMLVDPLRIFSSMFIRGRGWKDGMPGFLLCVFSAWYQFVTYAKYWEARFAKPK